ncbi:MAG TPA: ABC transporter permease [Armatimonadota bacterium]|jgi:ABC-type polysaccharide/polyol phosphate export permease
MFKELAEVWRFRELLINLVVRDMRVRYKNSALGFLWSFIIPLSQAAILTFVFKYIMQFKVPNYSAYLLCAILPFTFFNQSVLEASNSILGHSALVKKTYFPREIIPAAVVISNFIHFFFAMVVFLAYLLFLRFVLFRSGHPLVLATWGLLPVVMLINLMLNMGVALFLTSLNTFYEDVKYITMVGLNMLFYALPILYPYELAVGVPHHRLGWLMNIHFNLNPLSYLLFAYRKILLEPMAGEVGGTAVKNMPLNYGLLALAAFTSLLVFMAGYSYFNKRKWNFAERV